MHQSRYSPLSLIPVLFHTLSSKRLVVAGLLIAVMLVIGGVTTEPTLATPSAQNGVNNLSAEEAVLLVKVRQNGRLRVVVGVGATTPFALESQLSGAGSVQSQRAAIAAAQNAVLSLLSGANFTFHSQLVTLPYLTLTVDEAAFLRLAASSDVTSIEEDQVFTVALAQASPIVNADDAWGAGYTGSGQAVAILDSGTDSTHPFFGGRVKSEACYSLIDAPSGMSSACPNNQQSQAGSGAAAPPASAANPPVYEAGTTEHAVWSHGTHVAGIAAGAGASFSGVAKGADIIAIQVGSEGSAAICSQAYGVALQTCPLIPYSNILSALERVYFLRNDFEIAAVNMSLGGGSFTAYCDDFYPAITDTIDQLDAVGIAVVAATGNAGYTSSISFPGCISKAVAVGATTKSDNVATDYSNSASIVDLLAPGGHNDLFNPNTAINSSVIGGGFSTYNGTSMAAPMAAGAYAVIRSARNDATPEQILAALQSTGKPITDPRNGVTKPRIDVKAAADVIVVGIKAVRKVVINEIRVEGNAAIELYNADSRNANLTGWKLQLYSPAAALTEYTFPNFTLNSSSYVIVRQGSGTNSATELFMGGLNPGWGVGNAGAARLTNTVVAIDFLRWGSSTVDPGIGTAFVEINPTSPPSGENIGRDEFSTDYDTGLDWTVMGRTLGAVNIVTRPANDAPNNATPLTSLPYNTTVNIRNATKTGEPTPACAPDIKRTVWYRYQSATGGKVTFNTAGTSFDSVLAIYTGIGGTPSMVACNDDVTPGVNNTSRLMLNAQANMVYHIVAGANGGNGGLLHFAAFEGEFNDEIETARLISSLPYHEEGDIVEATIGEDDPLAECQELMPGMPFFVGETVWYKYTPASAGTGTLDTTGSDFVALVTVWSGSPGSLTYEHCYAPDLGYDDPEVVMTSGKTYYFVVNRIELLTVGSYLSFSLTGDGTAVTPTPVTPTPETPTPVTPTPETPTPETPTPDPAENLVRNSGFDEAGSTGKDAKNWTAVKPKGDRRVCQPDNLNFAKSAPCAFQFTGNSGLTTRLNQKITPGAVNPGDMLMIRFWAKGMQLQGAAQVQFQGRYEDGTSPTKRVIKLAKGNYPYTEFTDVLLMANAPIKDVRVMIQMKNGSGKFRIDDVQVYVTGSGVVPGPLPETLRGQ